MHLTAAKPSAFIFLILRTLIYYTWPDNTLRAGEYKMSIDSPPPPSRSLCPRVTRKRSRQMGWLRLKRWCHESPVYLWEVENACYFPLASFPQWSFTQSIAVWHTVFPDCNDRVAGCYGSQQPQGSLGASDNKPWEHTSVLCCLGWYHSFSQLANPARPLPARKSDRREGVSIGVGRLVLFQD